MTLVSDLLGGNRRALARLITQIENQAESAQEALAVLYPHTGRAHLVGVTGAPGTGKSSLVNQMALRLRGRQQTVAILAVDPTSPFTGGAILGDRIRMRDLAGDAGVFIRSMASRGSLGGLAARSADVIKALDAAGFDLILIETVGAGQAEVEIARHAQTVVVVEAPGMGDDVQAIKAGILEIADVLVVNKADDPRAKNTHAALRTMLELSGRSAARQMVAHHGHLVEVVMPQAASLSANGDGWTVPIHLTNALNGEGVDGLLDAVNAHRDHLRASGEMERRDRARVAAELDGLLREALVERLLQKVDRARLNELIEQAAARQIAPQTVIDRLLDEA